MAQFESLVCERRPRRIHRTRNDGQAPLDDRSEWTARPPGKLGRPLVAEIGAYLEFFALVRAPAGEL
jgi:hypothetical protein